ncbi:MAG: hypothetical protein KDD04_11050, partial [Sinomicrobium sp.]|nr:hypothetical protein [Sinomicrobium sp.]
KGSDRIRGKDLIKKLYDIDEEERGVQKLLDGLKKLEQLIYKFISVNELSVDPLEEQRLLTIGLKKRKHTDLFYQEAARYEKMLEQKPVTIMRLVAEWWLDHQRYFHQYAQQAGADIKWLEGSNKKLDLLIQLVKLRYLVESQNLVNVRSKGIAIEAPPGLFLNTASEKDTLEVIWLYREVLPLVKDPFNLTTARKFLYHFENKSGHLAAADRIVLAKLLYNALLRSINGPNPQGMSQLIHLSKYIVRHDLYLFEGVISDDEYLNLAIMSGVGGAFKFQDYFIHDHAKYLEENIREKAVRFVSIYRQFHLGNHEEAIRGLKELFPPNTQDKDKYVFRAKALLLRAYVAYY